MATTDTVRVYSIHKVKLFKANLDNWLLVFKIKRENNFFHERLFRGQGNRSESALVSRKHQPAG